MEYAGFCGAAYTIQNISADCQRCVNLYPQPDESGAGKNKAYLFSTPGLNKVADLTSIAAGGVRGNYSASNNRVFQVVGNFLIEIGSSWEVLGSYALPSETGSTPVSMTDNGKDMMIATGPNGYWFNFAANTLTQITDAVFFGAVGCGFIDGFIVFNQPDTQVFWKTNLYSTVIDPLGFASAEGNPDNLVTLLCDHREIWLFGVTSTEVWYDSGGANFPFSFIQGAYISHGIAAAYSAVRLDNTTFWLGNDEFGQGIAYRANGYAPVRISTFAMEQAWQKYPTITDAVAWTYQQDGHSFYVLNFPSGDATWVYDAATGLWHERAYLGTLAFNDGQLHRGRPNTHSFAFGKHVVGDWETGFLYQLSPLFLDDDNREIQRMRRAPFLDNELKRVLFSQFQLDMEIGKGMPPVPSVPGVCYEVDQHNAIPPADHDISFAVTSPAALRVLGKSNAGDIFTGWSVFQTDNKLLLNFYDGSFMVLGTTDLSTVSAGTIVTAPAGTVWFIMGVSGATRGGEYDASFTLNGIASSYSVTAAGDNFLTAVDSSGAFNPFPLGLVQPGSTVSVAAINEPEDGMFLVFYDASLNVLGTLSLAGSPAPTPPISESPGPTYTAPAGAAYWSVQTTGSAEDTYSAVYNVCTASTPGTGVTEIVGYTNATGAMALTGGRPLGDTGVAIQWSNFLVPPGNILPIDAVIQGIYPVFIGSQQVEQAVHRYNYDPPAFGEPDGFTTPFDPANDAPTFSSTEFYGPSLGTDLSALLAQVIRMDIDASVFSDGFLDTSTITAVGYAIYYTSAHPQFDGQIPPPFAVPIGQGIQWAIPFTVTTSNGNPTFGTVTATAATPITIQNYVEIEPLINLRWSDDGGYTWSNYYTRGMGKTGEYRKRVIWRRLGNGRQRVFEVSTGQNFVGLNLYNAYLELTETNS